MRKVLGITLFMICLWLPLIQMNISLFPEPLSYENRYLANMPTLEKISVKSIFKYKKDFESYFDDHFGFRNILGRLNGVAHFRLAGVSSIGRVVVGERNWLFFNDPIGGTNLNDYFGKANFTEDELQKIRDKIVCLNEWLKARKIHFIFVIAPDKHTVYEEYLPYHIRKRKGMITRADQLQECLRASGVDLVNLRDKLLISKSRYPYPLYYLTDTHWNPLGAFLGYEEIMKQLSHQYPEIHAQKLSDFSVSIGGDFDGNLTGFMNIRGLIHDPQINVVSKTPRRSTPVQVPYESGAGTTSAAAEMSNKHLPKLVMFHDSFANFLIPYMSENFSRSVYIYKHKIDLAIVEQEKPDIVIFEVVERGLGLGILSEIY